MSSTTKNDHKKLKSLAVLWLISLAPLMALVPIIPIAIATGNTGVFIDYSTSNIALMYSTQRKLLYDGTRWWADYNNGTQHEISYSSDKVTWTSAGAVWNASFTEDTDIKIYGSSVIYACTTRFVGGVFTYVVFRTGNISGTTISWGPIRTVYSYGAVPRTIYSCSTTYDGTTYFVGWGTRIGLNVDDSYKSTNKGVSWSNPLQSNDDTVGSIMISMTGGKAMLIRRLYSTVIPANTQGYSYIWNGAAWGGATQISTDKVGSNPGGAGLTDQDGSFSAVSDGTNADIVHMAYLNRTGNNAPYTYNIGYVRYQAGWQTPVNVESNVASTSQPTISYDDVQGAVVIAWMNNSLAYQRTFYFSGNASWGSVSEIGNPSSPIPSYLIGEEGRHNNQISYLIENGAGAPYNVTILTLQLPTSLTPQGSLELSGLKCGNIWVTPDKTYLTITATIQAQTPIQNVSVRFNDSLNVMQADYDNTTSRWNLSRGRDYVSLNPQATATSYYTAAGGLLTTANYTLQVDFMFLANEAILDKNNVDVQYEYALQNGSVTSWVTNATMNIYNKGGATEYVIQNNAGFLPGGDVYSVYAKNTSSISVNQTWVRLQHLHANFAVRLVLNSTNSGEDNLWQDFAHKGANEYYTNSTDWTIYYKIWYYDEHNHQWVQGWILSFVKQQGDIGSADEWTELNVTFYNGPNSVKTSSQNMSAWVEREPEARVRLWLDLWFNKMNASSVHGARLNPMYFGIHYTGWAIWGTGIAGQWEPMYKNESQAAAFDRLQDANGNENVTSPMLTCMKTEQILVMNQNAYDLEGISPLHYNYTIQIDNWDVLEPKLSPTRNMEGVNTPLIVEPLLPDKTASSFWAPIYAALQSIGGWIFKAFSSLAEIIWQAIRAQFPWFANWVDDINAMLANGITLATTMMSALVELFKGLAAQFWVFQFFVDMITSAYNTMAPIWSVFGAHADIWLKLLIILFGVIPFTYALMQGDLQTVHNDLNIAWGIIRTVVGIMYIIVSTLIGWIIQALPL